ncbi:MAG: hypothetical protein GY725_24405 [bacterium]|nr:hypothetical protein [bacterium]
MTTLRLMQPGSKRSQKRHTLGLALGAGGARGLAHVGVLKALGEAGVQIDAIVGTSIGALVGAIYAAGQLENFERQVAELEWADVMRLFDPVWPRSGLVSGERATEWLQGLLGDWRIEDLAIPFAAVAVDLVTGEEVLMDKGRVVDAVRASISIPGIFVPHRMGKQLLVDGALRNPVPVSDLESFDVDVRVAVNLHAQPVREIISRKTNGTKLSIGGRVSETIEKGLARFRRKGSRSNAGAVSDESGPNLFEVLTASMTVLEHELARHRLANDPVDVVIAPDVRGIRALEFHKSKRAIQAGHREVAAHLDDIEAALKRRRRKRTRRYWSAGSIS